MLTLTGMIVVFIFVIAIPSEHAAWFAPHKRWSENLGFLQQCLSDFTKNRKALLSVLGAVVMTYLTVPLFEFGLISKSQAIWTLVLASLVCAAGSILLLWREYKLRTRLGSYSKAFELFLALASFTMLVFGKSIAENEIQLLTDANPEEFSTASHALAAFYALWLWSILGAFIMALLAFSPVLLTARQYWPWSWEKFRSLSATQQKWPRRKTGFESIEQFAILLGFSYSALTLSGISGSDWALERMKEATVFIVVQTSFFKPDMETEKCMKEGYGLIRIVGDGDRVVLTNGADFKSLKCDIGPL